MKIKLTMTDFILDYDDEPIIDDIRTANARIKRLRELGHGQTLSKDIPERIRLEIDELELCQTLRTVALSALNMLPQDKAELPEDQIRRFDLSYQANKQEVVEWEIAEAEMLLGLIKKISGPIIVGRFDQKITAAKAAAEAERGASPNGKTYDAEDRQTVAAGADRK